jgi:hypothetical protein
MNHSVESCRWSVKAKREARSLHGTVRGLYRSEKNLHSKMSLSFIYKRLRNGRLGISKAKSRTDVCEICDAWDHRIEPKLTEFYVASEQKLTSLMPLYFRGFNCDLDGHPRAGSLRYAKEMLEFVKGHAARTIHARSDLKPEEFLALQETENDFIHELEKPAGWVNTVEEYNFHWVLRDYLRQQIAEDQRSPKDGFLYLWWDFQDA